MTTISMSGPDVENILWENIEHWDIKIQSMCLKWCNSPLKKQWF